MREVQGIFASDRRARRGMSRLVALASGSAFVALIAAVPAQAQAQTGPVATDGTSDSVNEIVVTAERRASRLEDVPMAITAVSGEGLERANVTSIHELTRLTPGAQIGFGGAFTQPSIRGVTSLTVGIGNENNVAIYVDGFYVSDTLSINTDLANIASVEVLKGPQGTLYGRNATGGAILINTLAPTDHFTGKVQASYARFDDRSVMGYLSGPIAEGVKFSVAGSARNSDGYIRKVDPTTVGRTIGNAAPIRQRSLRTKLEFDLSPDFTATLAYNHSLSSDPTGNLFTPFDHVSPALPGPPQRATQLGTASYNYETKTFARSNEGTLKLVYKTPIGTLSSYSGYVKRHIEIDYDFDGTYADLSYAELPVPQRSWQQSVDFVVDAIDHVDLVVGGLYFNDKFGDFGRASTINYGPGKVFTSRLDVIAQTEALAGYADATIHFTDALSVNIGGRYSSEKKTITQTTTTAAGVVTFPTTTRDKSFHKFTPRASIRYELAPRTNIYASYSQGFRSGSFNASGVASPGLLIPIRPEKVNAYEVGFKMASRKLRFDAAAFYYDYTDLNVSLILPNPTCAAPCGIVSLIANAPKAKIYGIDGQLGITPVEAFNISVGASWLHARYGSFTNAVGTGLNAATNLNVSGQLQDWTGKQMSRAPNFSGHVDVDYSVPVGGGSLLMGASLQYSDSFVISNPSLYGPLAGASLAGKQRFRRGATTLLNAQVTWTDASDHVSVGLFGKNLTDKKYRATYNGALFGDYSSLAAPITYGVRIGYKY